VSPALPRFRRALVVLRASLLAAPALLAAGPRAHAAGIFLNWDDCGIGGSRNKTFACATTTASDVLVASFVPPGGMSRYLGLYGTIEIQTAQPQLPDWWQLQGGGCRAGSISYSCDFSSYSGCSDFWSTRNALGGMNYEGAFQGANRGRVRVIYAVSENQAGSISAGDEYYAFRIIFNHAKSTGSGSCAGCSEPACITFTSLLLSQTAGAGDNTLTASGGSALVTWQRSTCASGTQTGTWGKLKSIYR
jgi:hypothetical protein